MKKTFTYIKLVKYFFFLIILIFIFFYGVIVGVYQIFPYKKIQSLKRIFNSDERIKPEYYLDLAKDLNVIELKGEELILIKNKLLEFLLPNKKIKVSFVDKDSKTRISTKYYGVSSNAILTKGNNSEKKCLLIYIQGHGGNPFNFDYHNKILKDFNKNGCDVLSMSMLGRGLNKGLAIFPTRFGELKLKPNLEGNHGNYSFFFDANEPNLDPLSLFLYPHMEIIDAAIKKYKYNDISMVGISGGGWYTTWLAALMPKIDKSIIYAGGMPFEFRIYGNMHGDWETVYSKIYDHVNYYNLFQMALIDREGKKSREVYLIYNDEDSCCYSNPHALALKTKINDNPNFPKIIIDKNKEHSMNSNLVISLLNKK